MDIKHASMLTLRTVLFATLLVALSVASNAQETISIDKTTEVDTGKVVRIEPPSTPVRTLSLEAFGGYAVDMNSASDLALPNIPTCCPGYDGATGGGFVGGLGMQLPLSNTLEFVGRLTLHSTSVTQASTEAIKVRDGNTTIDATINHELTSSMAIVSVEPAVLYKLSEGFGLLAGFRVGSLMSATYAQQEKLDDGIAYDYSDGSGIRNSSSGNIPQTSVLQFGMVFGARYALPLNASKTFHLVPEVQYSPLFTSFISGQSWSVSSLRMMVGVVYDLTTKKVSANPLRPK